MTIRRICPSALAILSSYGVYPVIFDKVFNELIIKIVVHVYYESPGDTVLTSVAR
jgi:uncharacterized membrane protein